MIVLFRLGLKRPLLFPTEGMIGVVAYLVTCWPDCGKKIEVFALRNGNRTEEKMELSSLISCHWLSVHLPFFCEIPSFSIVSPPLLLLVFVSAPFSLDLCRKNKGLRISKSDQSVSAMSSVFYATSMNRFHKVPWSVPLMNRCWISHSSMFGKKWGQLWWQK